MRKYLISMSALVLAYPAHAEMAKSQFTASNGIVVDVNTDAFAGRREYSAPSVEFTPDGGGSGGAVVAEVFDNGKLHGLTIQGFVIYSGEWRHYSSAIFKGGAPTSFRKAGSNVGDCTGGCTLSEDFIVDITPTEAKAHAENGVLPIQLRGTSGSTALIAIPLSYVEAVAEVAH